MIVERMAGELFLPTNFIARLAKSASYEYKEYLIPKHAGGNRMIEHPSRRLKAVQKWLLANVLEAWPVHDAATAYRKGRSIWQNAATHVGSAYLLRMDLKDFFPSLSADDLRRYRAKRPIVFREWTDEDFAWFTHFVFRFDRLTIGAPTSPAMSNALCFDLDVALQGISESQGVRYTRYADDLFFSTNEKDVLSNIEGLVEVTLKSLEVPRNLQLNTGKTRHSSKKGARRVTGIVLGCDGKCHVGRQLKRKVRSQVHKLGTLSPDQRARLAGTITYIMGFEPDFINSLIQKYGYEIATSARYGSP
jgi:RNA-directed DNA polymerase